MHAVAERVLGLGPDATTPHAMPARPAPTGATWRRRSLRLVPEVDGESVAQITARLDAIERALDRLADGTYRACELCGAPIEPALLEADATRVGCADHPALG